MTTCARNLPQHFNGCTCTANGAAPESGIDLSPTVKPPSTNPYAAPFENATTLEELDDYYDAYTSPETISCDGERSASDVQDVYARLAAAYWTRRDEIDPMRVRAFCRHCLQEFDGVDGSPSAHDNGNGPCPGGA